MTDQPLHEKLADAWIKATGPEAIRDSWRPAWFDEKTGTLGVDCRNAAYLATLRLVGPNLIRRMNSALPTPIIKRVTCRLRAVRVLVTGSRSWQDVTAIDHALLDVWHDASALVSPDAPFIVVHGDCPTGADALAKQWALDNGVRHEPHPADWAAPCPDNCLKTPHRKQSPRHGEYCPMAGHRRNQLMVDLGADLLLAFRLNNSRGTTDCINRAKNAGIPVRILEERS